MMRMFATGVALALAAAAGPQAHAETAAGGHGGGVLTITFDDASRTQHEIGLEIARAFDMSGTIFVASGIADEAARNPGGWGMDWRAVRDFRDAGWEIGAHSDSHPKMTELTDERLVIETEVPHDEIAAHVGIAPVSFASPFGDFDDRTLEEITRRYAYHLMAWGGNEGRNPWPGADPHRIGRMNVDKDVPAAGICAEIGDAAAKGTWLVLMFHGFRAEDPQPYETTPDAFREILTCAAARREEGRLRIMTVQQAMETLAAMAQGGG